jgi:hypothetical protein
MGCNGVLVINSLMLIRLIGANSFMKWIQTNWEHGQSFIREWAYKYGNLLSSTLRALWL